APEAQVKRAKETRINQNGEATIREWLAGADDLRILGFQDDFFAIHKNHEADLQFLQSHLYLKKSGVRIGKVMGKDLVPNHELALSLILNENVQRVDVTREQAISYLKRDELKLETDIRGWALICYQGHALGWAKMLGNRMNNYFPKEMRIVNQNIR
ncbi:MAG TPA: RNA methyltransferase, partial [Daejeonella sp.]